MILKFPNLPMWAVFKRTPSQWPGWKIFRPKKAFTLIEILLVCSLFSVIAIALFQSLSSGLKIWERGRLAAKEDDVVIFFDKIGQDLANSISFSVIPFSGKADTITFAAVISRFLPQENNAPNDFSQGQIGQVEYFFDPGSKNLCYRRANYGLALKAKFFPDVVLVKNLRSVKFQYFYRSDGNIIVQDQIKERIPAGVMIEVNFGSNRDYRQMRRIIPIAIGS